jgi:hypothetical protein
MTKRPYGKQSGPLRRLKRGPADRRFFGAPFAGARLCCGPATALAQVVVAQNALPPPTVLGYSVSHTVRRRVEVSPLNGAQKYQIWPLTREAPQSAIDPEIGVALAETRPAVQSRSDPFAPLIKEWGGSGVSQSALGHEHHGAGCSPHFLAMGP